MHFHFPVCFISYEMSLQTAIAHVSGGAFSHLKCRRATAALAMCALRPDGLSPAAVRCCCCSLNESSDRLHAATLLSALLHCTLSTLDTQMGLWRIVREHAALAGLECDAEEQICCQRGATRGMWACCCRLSWCTSRPPCKFDNALQRVPVSMPNMMAVLLTQPNKQCCKAGVA